jgi:hypothetical protein
MSVTDPSQARIKTGLPTETDTYGVEPFLVHSLHHSDLCTQNRVLTSG